VKRVRPEIRIIGVEPVDSDAMTQSLAAGRRVKLPHVGLFADGTYGGGLNGVAGNVRGLFYGDAGQFGAQVINAVVLVAFCSLMTIAFFTIMKRTMGMRSTEEAEIAGLDLPELGALAYPDFLEAQGPVFSSIGVAARPISAKSLREEIGS